MKRLATILAVCAFAVLVPLAATAAVVPPIAADAGDTEYPSLDLGNVYVSNDATNLIIAFDYNRSGWCDINLQLAFNTRPGGTGVDPFCRAIDWTTAPDLPDFMIYDVIPTQCNGFNYEVLYEANGSGGWNTLQDGSNGLGIVDGDTDPQVVVTVPLSRLGLSCGPGGNAVVQFEIAVTQEGCSKPGFDFIVNDGQQRSTPSGTCFDIGPCEPSKPTEYLTYVLDCPVPAQNTSWGGIKSLYR